jgi:hypothetical protein
LLDLLDAVGEVRSVLVSLPILFSDEDSDLGVSMRAFLVISILLFVALSLLVSLSRVFNTIGFNLRGQFTSNEFDSLEESFLAVN